MKLTKILESVLSELNVPKPEDAYKFDSITKKDLGYGVMHRYVYTNYDGQLMEVTVMSTKLSKDPGITLYVAFGLHDPDVDDEYESDEEEERKYKSQTGANDMLKVLATVVNAVNQTAKKVGGMDKVYAISYNPSDKRRKNIYDHYIQTLFPGFKKDTNSSSSSFTRFINTNFSSTIKEIGDSSNIKPYTNVKRYSDDSDDAEPETEFFWKTEDGVEYRLIITKFRMDEFEDEETFELSYDVLFGIMDKHSVTDYSVTSKDTKTGNVFRVMATVIDLIKKEITIDKKNGFYVKEIAMTPSKRYTDNDTKDVSDMRRANLYMAYIKKNMPPGSTVKMDAQGQDITIILP